MVERILKDYQETGRDFLAADFARILGDEPGLGKTGQAITAAIKVGAKRILVFCPAVLLVNWQREFELWWPRYANYRLPPVVISETDLLPKNVSKTAPLICVVNFDKASMRDNLMREATNVWAKFVVSSKWDVIIIDEAHNLKTMEANRTKTIYGELQRNNPRDETYWWLLTGTLIPNHAGELYSHLRALTPNSLRRADGRIQTQAQFEDLYCIVTDTKYGRSIQGTKKNMLPTLRQKIAPLYLGRKSKDVLKDLPPLTFVEFPIALKPKTDQAKAALNDASRTIAQLIDDCSTEDEILETLRRDELALSVQRRIIGILKAESISELIIHELMMNNFEKRIVFMHHTDAINKLVELLGNFKCVTLHGATPVSERMTAVDRFQNDPDTRVFIGQTLVCREGLTLTAANQVILGEPSWTPKDNFQAAKRASRIGQTKPVLARLISAANTVDDIIMRVLERKTNEINDFFG